MVRRSEDGSDGRRAKTVSGETEKLFFRMMFRSAR